MDINELKRRISSLAALPALPPVVQDAMGGGGVFSSGAFGDVWPLDAPLVQELMQRAEALPPHDPPADLAVALSRLGRSESTRIIIQHSVPALFPPEPGQGLDLEAFWRHAHTAGVLADRMAQALHLPDAHLAYAAGFFHDIGKVALDRLVPDGYSRAIEMAYAHGLQALEAERRELGLDHTLAGKWLAEAWRLPGQMIDTIWLHHHPPGALDETRYPVQWIYLVRLADLLAHRIAPEGSPPASLSSEAEEFRNRLGISLELLNEITAAPIPPRLSATASPGEQPAASPETHIDRRRLERRLERYHALHALDLRLGALRNRRDILIESARALRDTFAVRAGGCFVLSPETSCLEGVVWPDPHSDPAPVDLPAERLRTAWNEAIDSSLANLLDTLLAPASAGDTPGGLNNVVQHHGLLAVPMPAQNRRAGQFILDVSGTSLGLSADDFTDLLAFAETTGNALTRAETWERLSDRGEDMATALWRQELIHRRQIQAECLAGIGRMAAGAAHEINNPLAIISGRAQILLNRGYPDEDLRALETIVKQSRRISKILLDLMQFARPADPHFEATPVGYVLHQVAAMLVDRFEREAIEVIEDYAQDLPRVQLDRRQIQQVFLNIILNAEQAMAGRGGVLTLRVKPGPDRRSVMVQMSDTGHGISTDILDKVFEPFFTTRSGNENTGLGLAVCHGIIENHRGAITLHSEPGAGATCTITLPAMAENSAPKNESKPAPAKPLPQKPENAPSILIAIADTGLREVLQETLRGRGYQTRTAADSLETLAAVMGFPPGLILLDLTLPPVEGAPLLRHLAQRAETAPIIAIASQPDHEAQEDAIRLGARACLQTPFEIERLLKEIAHLLDLPDTKRASA